MERDEAGELRRALTDPYRLIHALNLDKGARKQRRGVMIACPWHDESTPSCSVRLARDETISAHCFGCDEGGDVFSLIAAAHKLNVHTQFREVLRVAAEVAGRYDLIREVPPMREAYQPPPASIDRYHNVARWLLDQCTPVESGEAHAFAAKKWGPSVARAAASQGWRELPPKAEQGWLLLRLVDVFGHETVLSCGLTRARDDGSALTEYFDFPYHRLIIPWLTSGDDPLVCALQRRRLDDDRANKYVFPPQIRPHEPYGAQRFFEGATPYTTVVWVEGAVDAVAAQALSGSADEIVLGIPGTSSWQERWAVRYAAGRSVIVAFDADRAGDKAAEVVAADCFRAGATRVRRLRPRSGDWAEILRGRGNVHR